VSSTRNLLTRGRRRFRRDLLAGLKEGKVSESGTLIGVFMARSPWTGEQEIEREGLDIRER
jgi:hypothetical protein